MKIAIKVMVFSFLMLIVAANAAYADGPHLWLSTDPDQFNEGGTGYSSTASGWGDDSYIADSLPFTAYLYNAASTPGNGADNTAYGISLIVTVHSGETNGSITIEDAWGATQTINYSDFTTTNPYPGGGHSIDGIYAVLTPSQPINLSAGGDGNANTTSNSSSWTQFVVKSSSFSEVHFDAGSTNGFYNPGSHDINFTGGGNNPVPEPATMSLLGMGLAGLLARRKKVYRP